MKQLHTAEGCDDVEPVGGDGISALLGYVALVVCMTYSCAMLCFARSPLMSRGWSSFGWSKKPSPMDHDVVIVVVVGGIAMQEVRDMHKAWPADCGKRVRYE